MSKLGGKVMSEDTDRDSIGQVNSVVAGTDISVNSTDPANPIVSSTAAGEANTASNLGAGEGSVFKQKTGVNLEHRTLKAGTNITITEDANEILIVAAGAAAATFSGALVTHSTTQVVAGTAALAFDTETYDEGGWHDNATNNSRLTVPAGVTRVRLTGAMSDTTSVTGQFICTLSKNGSTTSFTGSASGETESAGGDNAGWASAVLEVIEGDYFECEGFATTSRTTNADGRTYFSIEKVS